MTTSNHGNMRQSSSSVMELVNGGIDLVERVPLDIVLLAARIGVGMVFLKSAFTKAVEWSIWDALTFNLELGDNTYLLFQYEYAVPVLPFALAAELATYMESLLPLLLFIGLATRLSALGLFGMTCVIQFFVYPGNWDEHLLWAAALGLIAIRGPGVVSLDHVLGRLLRGR